MDLLQRGMVHRYDLAQFRLCNTADDSTNMSMGKHNHEQKVI